MFLGPTFACVLHSNCNSSHVLNLHRGMRPELYYRQVSRQAGRKCQECCCTATPHFYFDTCFDIDSCTLQACDEEKLLGHLGVVLYEYLGEEYPEVLGSILGALKAIVNVIGMTKMTPPIKDLLPRLTPILKNRHEKVQLLLGVNCCGAVASCLE